jgi:hypothetical protein
MFRPSELADAKDQGACSRDFLLRVIDKVDRAATLATLHRRQVAQSLRELVDSMDKKPKKK